MKIEEDSRTFDGIKYQDTVSSSTRKSFNANNSELLRANIKEEWWEGSKTTSGSWETR